jgi:hypothetical protein
MTDSFLSVFLTTSLAICGVLVAFLGARHQHLSGLIRAKAKQIISPKDQPLLPKTIENIMVQVSLFRYRNHIIRWVMQAALFGGLFLAVDVWLVQTSNASSIQIIGWAVLGLGLLPGAVWFTVRGFFQSQTTLDLELMLMEAETDMKFVFGKHRKHLAKLRDETVKKLEEEHMRLKKEQEKLTPSPNHVSNKQEEPPANQPDQPNQSTNRDELIKGYFHIREEVHREYLLINQRLMWLVTSQSFCLVR